MIFVVNGKSVDEVWESLGERVEAAIADLIQSPEPKWPTPDDAPLTPLPNATFPPHELGSDEPEPGLTLLPDNESDLDEILENMRSHALCSQIGRAHVADGQLNPASTFNSPPPTVRVPSQPFEGDRPTAREVPASAASSTALRSTTSAPASPSISPTTPTGMVQLAPSPPSGFKMPVLPAISPGISSTAACTKGTASTAELEHPILPHPVEPILVPASSSATTVPSTSPPRQSALSPTSTVESRAPTAAPSQSQDGPSQRIQKQAAPLPSTPTPNSPPPSIRSTESSPLSTPPSLPRAESSWLPASQINANSRRAQSHGLTASGSSAGAHGSVVNAQSSTRESERRNSRRNANGAKKSEQRRASTRVQDRAQYPEENSDVESEDDASPLEGSRAAPTRIRDTATDRSDASTSLQSLSEGGTKRPGHQDGAHPRKKPRVELKAPREPATPPILATFPPVPSLVLPGSQHGISAVSDILEPHWEACSENEAESRHGDDDMELDESPPGIGWHSLPHKTMKIEVPTPWLNAGMGSVGLQLAHFEYSYRAKV